MKIRRSKTLERYRSLYALQRLDADNRLNQYRFSRYIPEFQQHLESEYVKKELGALAVEKLRALSELLIPAISKDGVISADIIPSNEQKIPLWFVDDSIKVDYQPLIFKDPSIRELLTTPLSDYILSAIQRESLREFTFDYTTPSGYTLEYGRSPIILLFSGNFGASMSSVICHELIHAGQIIDGVFDVLEDDEDRLASGELEAYYYQAKFEKGLQNSRHIDYSVFGMSCLAQKINYIRHMHARTGEPFTVTPRMKQELIARGLGSSVFTSMRQDTIEKTD